MEFQTEKTELSESRMELKFIDITASYSRAERVNGLRFRCTKNGHISATISSDIASELIRLNRTKARIAKNGADRYIVFDSSLGYFKFSRQGGEKKTLRCDSQSVIKQILPEIGVLISNKEGIECNLYKNHGYNGNVSVYKLGTLKKV